MPNKNLRSVRKHMTPKIRGGNNIFNPHKVHFPLQCHLDLYPINLSTKCQLSSLLSPKMGHTIPSSWTIANCCKLPLTASLSLSNNHTKHLTFIGTCNFHTTFHLSEASPPNMFKQFNPTHMHFSSFGLN